jgi:prevent-host-death family protein
VSENEIGLREGRAKFGDLVNRAEYAGEVTYITRHGRRVAAIAPINLIPQERSMSIQDMSTSELAKMHLGYNYGDEAVAEEFHKRFPVLAGWSEAIAYLFRLDFDRPVEPRQEGKPVSFGLLDRSSPPGAVALKEEYTRRVRAIADSEEQ